MACLSHCDPAALRNELIAPIKQFCDGLQKRVPVCKRDEFEDDTAELFLLCGRLLPFLQVASRQCKLPASSYSDTSFAMMRECDRTKYSTPASAHVFVNNAYQKGGSCSFPCSQQAALDSKSKVFSAAVTLLHRVLPEVYDTFTCPEQDNLFPDPSHDGNVIDIDDGLENVNSASSSGASSTVQVRSPQVSPCRYNLRKCGLRASCKQQQSDTELPRASDAVASSLFFTPGAKKFKAVVSDEQMDVVKQQYEKMYALKGCITPSTTDFLRVHKKNGCLFLVNDMDFCIQYGFASKMFDQAPYNVWVAGFSAPRHEIKNYAVRTHVESVVGACCYTLALEFHGTHTHMDNVQLSQIVISKCPCMMCSIIRGLGHSNADVTKLSNYKIALEKYLTDCRNWTLQCLHLTLGSVTPIDVLQQMCAMFCKYCCDGNCSCAVPWKQAEEELLNRLETMTAMQTLSHTMFATLCQVLCEAQAMHQQRLKLQKESPFTQLHIIFSANAP
jgi:hypothetical protein